jgi:hypothetical protein
MNAGRVQFSHAVFMGPDIRQDDFMRAAVAVRPANERAS